MTNSEQIFTVLMDMQKTQGAMAAELTEVHAQTIKTNGRVTSLEKWRWILTGASMAIGAIGAAMWQALFK